MRKCDEPFVREQTIFQLNREDFTRAAKLGKKLGADIVVRHRTMGHYFIVECKGEGKGKSPDSKMETNILMGLGQLSLRFTSHNGRRYGLALPESHRKRVLGKLSPETVSRWKLHLFLVDGTGKVDHIPPGRLKRLVRKRAGS